MQSKGLQVRQKILVVDDEAKIIRVVKAYLEREGFRVIEANDGKAAIDIARREKPDLVVLDLMLPEMSGWDVCRTLRQESSIPILMLTARDDDTDKIVGLELGADDYLTKPFNPKELVARVRAILRRVGPQRVGGEVIVAGDLRIDVEKREVIVRGDQVHLTPTEFDLLSVMARQPGRVFSRSQLLDMLTGVSFEGFDRAIDSHIKNLRQKIESDPRKPRHVLTVFGVGYKFSGD